MKRLWIAAALLALLLGISLVNGRYAQSLTGDMTKQLRQAQSLTEQGDWDRAESVTRQVYEDWQGHHFYFHTTMRHSDTDQVLRTFRQVMEYLRLQDHYIQQCAGCELCSNSDNWPDGKFPESGYLCRYKRDSDHLAYILLQDKRSGKQYWGVGLSHNINLAPLRAILSAINRAKRN